jgi:SAM-dependent methyltransferase
MSLAAQAKSLARRLSHLLPRDAPVDRLAAEPWFLDAVDLSQGKVTARGWAFVDEPRADADYASRFAFNGQPFDRVEYPLKRPDVAEAFPGRRGAEECGFVLAARAPAMMFRGGVLEISCRDVATPRGASARESWFWPDPELHSDLPDEDRRYRVIGNRDPTGFLLSGCTDFHRLDRACRFFTGKGIADHASILDWGCGCGRIARHMPPRPEALRGCDIDADNVAWCAAHLPGRYAASSLRPPLPYDDGAFDLVYGVSVFTHFRPELEALWLAELARVAAPGATLMMTIHGQTAIDYARLGTSASRALSALVQRKGILCSGRNDQLDGHAAHEDEYVNVYHSHGYVRRAWGRHFEIVDILPGYIFTHDLAILRKPRPSAP